MLNKINATVLFVKDLEASKIFYRDLLEFKVKDQSPGFASFELGDQQELALMDRSTFAELLDKKSFAETDKLSNSILLAAFVDDADATFRQLKSKGVQFFKEPFTQPWGQRTAYFKDPDGNVWEISHFLKNT